MKRSRKVRADQDTHADGQPWMEPLPRRSLFKYAGAVGGGLMLAGPFQAFAGRVAQGDTILSAGYGPLEDKGDLMLPGKFKYEIISREGDLMSDGLTSAMVPTPSRFDGMAAFPNPGGGTILIRNHENRRRLGDEPGMVQPNETAVDVPFYPGDPSSPRYDESPYIGGVTKLIAQDVNNPAGMRIHVEVQKSFPLIGGTMWNCAGGMMPWGSWVTCEERYENHETASGTVRHGYIFEVDAFANGPVPATPIRRAGRFQHEAVAWLGGMLYETEDRPDACFYQYTPGTAPGAVGDLAADSAAGGGVLRALRLPELNATETTPFDTTRGGSWPGGVGASQKVDWVTIPTPDPGANRDNTAQRVRRQGQVRGAAIFQRTEGCWSADGKVYFDCTSGGGTDTEDGHGQVWELDPIAATLTLLYEAPPRDLTLRHPDNIVVAPTGDLFLCEDAGEAAGDEGTDALNNIRGLTPDGRIFDFARAITNGTEFCGACFDPNGEVLYVNQQGNPRTNDTDVPLPGVTYAIWGPWDEKAKEEVGE
jgi:uncharacterized protein